MAGVAAGSGDFLAVTAGVAVAGVVAEFAAVRAAEVVLILIRGFVVSSILGCQREMTEFLEVVVVEDTTEVVFGVTVDVVIVVVVVVVVTVAGAGAGVAAGVVIDVGEGVDATTGVDATVGVGSGADTIGAEATVGSGAGVGDGVEATAGVGVGAGASVGVGVGVDVEVTAGAAGVGVTTCAGVGVTTVVVLATGRAGCDGGAELVVVVVAGFVGVPTEPTVPLRSRIFCFQAGIEAAAAGVSSFGCTWMGFLKAVDTTGATLFVRTLLSPVPTFANRLKPLGRCSLGLSLNSSYEGSAGFGVGAATG